jgi:hypothetical protein
MNIQLDPPQVPPLSQSKRSQLRNRVMDKSRPAGSTRRWAAPVIAVGAVAAVVAGTLAITNNSVGAPGVAGTTPSQQPSMTPTQPPRATATNTPGRTPSNTPGGSITSGPIELALPADIDLGPVPLAEATSTARESCNLPGAKGTALQVLWARRVVGLQPTSRAMVLLVKGAAQPGGYYDQGLAVCHLTTSISAVRDTDWAKHPTKAQGISVLGGNGFAERGATGKPVRAQGWTLYRARPEIARIESRYVWAGGSGSWTKGVVQGGFAFTDSRVSSEKKLPENLTEQLRAYDASGKPVPVHP